jgi:hypothetical protein
MLKIRFKQYFRSFIHKGTAKKHSVIFMVALVTCVTYPWGLLPIIRIHPDFHSNLHHISTGAQELSIYHELSPQLH